MTVKQQQALLIYLGYAPGTVDGVAGTKTAAAMSKFVSDYNLSSLPEQMQIASLVGAVAGTVDKVADSADNETYIWQFLRDAGLSECGAAGLIGNLIAESDLKPRNLQDTYNTSLGMTDDQYTTAVDNGAYTNFANDNAGYGVAQWTYCTRKQKLLDYAKTAGKSIGDLQIQLDFLIAELSGSCPRTLETLKTATSVKAASDAVLLNYECPLDSGEAVRAARASIGEAVYQRHTTGDGKIKMAEQYLQRDGYYHIPRGVNVQLSKKLWSREVMCCGNGCCAESIISPDMVAAFQAIRDDYGAPISIADAGGSGYRCKKHNAAVGGANNSLHLTGSAFDLHAADKTKLLQCVQKRITDGEIGVYDWGVHAGVWNRGYVNNFKG